MSTTCEDDENEDLAAAIRMSLETHTGAEKHVSSDMYCGTPGVLPSGAPAAKVPCDDHVEGGPESGFPPDVGFEQWLNGQLRQVGSEGVREEPSLEEEDMHFQHWLEARAALVAPEDCDVEPGAAAGTASATLEVSMDATSLGLRGAGERHGEREEEALAAGALVDFRDGDGNTALITLAAHSTIGNCIKPLSVLMRHNPNVNAQNLLGETALQVAARNCNSVLALQLLQRQADVNMQDQFCETALTEAVLKQDVGLVKLLLRFGASVCLAFADLDHACVDCPDILKLLRLTAVAQKLENGASKDPSPEAVRGFAPPADGETERESNKRERSAILREHHVDREYYEVRNPAGSHGIRGQRAMAEQAATQVRAPEHVGQGPRIAGLRDAPTVPRKSTKEERWRQNGIFHGAGVELRGSRNEEMKVRSTQQDASFDELIKRLLPLQDFPEVGEPFEEIVGEGPCTKEGAVLTIVFPDGAKLHVATRRGNVLVAELRAWIQRKVDELKLRPAACKVKLFNKASFPPIEFSQAEDSCTLEQ